MQSSLSSSPTPPSPLSSSNLVFQVNDHFGSKLTDSTLICYILQSLVKVKRVPEVMLCLSNMVWPDQQLHEYMELEIKAFDQPSLLSEIFTILTKLNCCVVPAMHEPTSIGRYQYSHHHRDHHKPMYLVMLDWPTSRKA